MHCPHCGAASEKAQVILKVRNADNLFLVPELSGAERSWVKCVDCGIFYSTPELSDAQIDQMYRVYRSTNFRKEAEDDYFDRITAKNSTESENFFKVEFLKQYLEIPPSSCLDIGCGGGVLIHSLSQEYPDTDFYGVEPTPNFCDLANRRTNAQVVNGYYTRSVYPNIKFDLITCCQVFEHVKDLKSFVQDLKTNLSCNSKFFLEVPSTNDFETLETSHSRFCEPSHLWYFSDSFLRNLFAEHGFEVIVSQTEKTVRGRMNLSMILKLKD